MRKKIKYDVWIVIVSIALLIICWAIDTFVFN
jgi:hypothetical protein